MFTQAKKDIVIPISGSASSKPVEIQLQEVKASEAKQKHDGEDEFIRCPILTEIFHTPVIMSGCDHTYEEDTARKVDKCPECRAPKQGYPGYKLNRAVKKIVDNHLENHPGDKKFQHTPEAPSLLIAEQQHARYGAFAERKEPLPAFVAADVAGARAAENSCCGDCCNSNDCASCCSAMINASNDPFCCALAIDDGCAGCSGCAECTTDACAADCPACACPAIEGEAALPCCIIVGGLIGIAAAAGAMVAATAYSVKEVAYSCLEPCPGGFIRGSTRSLVGAAAGYGTWILSEGLSDNMANYFGVPDAKPAFRCWFTTIGAATGIWVSGLVRVSRQGLFGGNAPDVLRAQPVEREPLLAAAPPRQ